MEIESICHRRLGGLLPRWIARALPRAEDDGFGRGPAAERRLPDSAATSFSLAASGRTARVGPRNRIENAAAPPSAAPRPLRVLQIIDDTSSAAGRIVISGRMADVCAELERLAALESRRSCA